MTPTEARAHEPLEFHTADSARAYLHRVARGEFTAQPADVDSALSTVERYAWAVGRSAERMRLASGGLEIAAFLARPDSLSSSSHGEALVLLGKAREALGGG